MAPSYLFGGDLDSHVFSHTDRVCDAVLKKDVAQSLVDRLETSARPKVSFSE